MSLRLLGQVPQAKTNPKRHAYRASRVTLDSEVFYVLSVYISARMWEQVCNGLWVPAATRVFMHAQCIAWVQPSLLSPSFPLSCTVIFPSLLKSALLSFPLKGSFRVALSQTPDLIPERLAFTSPASSSSVPLPSLLAEEMPITGM